jgi:hypothetical protein
MSDLLRRTPTPIADVEPETGPIERTFEEAPSNAATAEALPAPARWATPLLDLAAGVAQSAPARQPAPTAPSLDDRCVAAGRMLAEVEREVAQEDALVGNESKTHTTSTPRLVERLAAGHRALDAALASPTEATVAALEAAAQAALTEFRATPMASRDGAPGPTLPGEAKWLSDASFSDLIGWQTVEPGQPWVKFAVPPPAAGAAPRMRVGSPALAHVDVAGGEAISAGLLRFDPADHSVGEVENTSGGFRPGRLRNATAAGLLGAAGYTVTVHDNETGDYLPTNSIGRR